MLDFTAISTVELIGISVRSVNSIYLKIRLRMAESCDMATPFNGAVGFDESYFGVRRVRGHMAPNTVIHFDIWRGCDGMVDMKFDKHFRVNHGENEFANGERYINGVKTFWSYAKRRLAKFNGVPKYTFYLHL